MASLTAASAATGRAALRRSGVCARRRSRSAVVVRASGSFSRAVQFRPCIDIHQGRVKQIVGGTLKDSEDGEASSETPETNFETETSSAEFAEMYRRDGIRGGHVIMLSRDDATTEAAMRAVSAFPGGLQVGGGVTAETAAPLLDAGASHVIVTSYVFRDGAVDRDRLRKLVDAVGKDRVVLDLSCRKRGDDYFVVTDRWQKWTDLKVDAATMADLAAACDEFLVHGVDVEGMKLGIDEELVRRLGEHSPIPVTYAGGARSIADLELVRRAGNAMVDVTVGSALDCFGGALPYDDVVAWHNEQKTLVA
jgi:phosphoribosylformimino-5-aminoimidazole carboxamide ribotide isomerase